MDWTLLVGMAHEFPAVGTRLFGDARIVLANASIERQRRANAQALEQLEEAPEADPHPVFVPAPVRHIGNLRLPGRRCQDLARHRLANIPNFEIDDGPENNAGAAGKPEG